MSHDKKTLRVGIVGCGQATQCGHIPSFRRIKGVKVAAVCDKNEELASKMAKRFDIERYYSDFAEMLSRGEIDFISICTPPQAHASLSIQAMEAGCHVLVEKPMALSLKECDEMISASERNGMKLGVVHDRLFSSQVMQAKSMIQKGKIGRLTGIEIRGFYHEPRLIMDKDQWCHKLHGGIFGELLPHSVYLAMGFLGKVEPVAVYTKKTSDQEWISADEVRIILEGEKGIGTITASLNSLPNSMETIDIFGTKANLHIVMGIAVIIYSGGSSYLSWALDLLSRSFQGITSVGSTAVKMAVSGRHYHSGHVMLIRNFVDSIQNNTNPPVLAYEGREVMRVLEKITLQIG